MSVSLILRAGLMASLVWVCAATSTLAGTITGSVDVTSPRGQQLSLTMTVDDANTTIEMMGPDYSWFAFGLGTDTMQGYALIALGLDDQRNVVEWNVAGVGAPGEQQETQNIAVDEQFHDAANDLTRLVVTRASATGDPEDLVFSPEMQTLDVVWSYFDRATPASPRGFLGYHGEDGRGTATIQFSPVPEPSSAILVGCGVCGLMLLSVARRASARTSTGSQAIV